MYSSSPTAVVLCYGKTYPDTKFATTPTCVKFVRIRSYVLNSSISLALRLCCSSCGTTGPVSHRNWVMLRMVSTHINRERGSRQFWIYRTKDSRSDAIFRTINYILPSTIVPAGVYSIVSLIRAFLAIARKFICSLVYSSTTNHRAARCASFGASTEVGTSAVCTTALCAALSALASAWPDESFRL